MRLELEDLVYKLSEELKSLQEENEQLKEERDKFKNAYANNIEESLEVIGNIYENLELLED